MGYQQADFDALLQLTSAPVAGVPGLPGASGPAPAALSSQHIAGPDADRLLWQRVAETSEAVQELMAEATAAPAFGPLLADVFNVFFKTAPTLRDPNGIDPAVRQNRSWVENLLSAESTATTRPLTQRDDLASALATLAAGREIWQALQEVNDPPQPGEGDPNAGGPGSPANAHGGGLAPEAIQAIAERAAQAAADGAAQAQSANGWGTADSPLSQAPLGARVDFALRLRDPRFQALARLIGRLKGIARTQHRAALRHSPEEIHRLTQGDDLSRVLPAELVLLRHPGARLDVARRLLEHQLVQYDLTPRPRTERGPLVVCLDASGSMGGDRIDWAAAVGLALLDTARRQHRGFAACYFNGGVQATFDWPQGRVSPQEMLAFATVDASGGTDFTAPLAWALTQFDRKTYAHGDLVFVTDGQAPVDASVLQRWQTVRARLGIRGFGILIQSAATAPLTDIVDRIWSVAGPDDAAAAALFAELVA
jgi:Mg-chelatase subunit ChlD